MHSRVFLNLFAGLLIAVGLLVLLLIHLSAPPEAPSAAAMSTPAAAPGWVVPPTP